MPPTTRAAFPPEALPIKAFSSQVSWPAGGPGHFDVTALCADGRIRHVWFVVGEGWHGPEDLTGAG